MLPTTCIYVYFKWIINNPLFQNKLLNDLLHIQNCMKFNIFDLLLDLKYSIFQNVSISRKFDIFYYGKPLDFTKIKI